MWHSRKKRKPRKRWYLGIWRGGRWAVTKRRNKSEKGKCPYFFMRIIMHLDMDAFFAAIEERENPKLKGKPIVVGADPKGGMGRGVVSTSSYAARKFGIKSGM